MRVLICGHRDFDDWVFLDKTLGELACDYDVSLIIEGGAMGADFLARCWANAAEIPYEEYPADWKKYGKKAGSIRNQQMLDEGKPDLVVAFIDHSRDWSGTHDMVQKAKKAGVEVREIDIRKGD